MRILKIELQNINSIKTDKPIIIDFESDRFMDVGLYAITGSTGAGKTTILDAITIAMYHSVPRFNKSNIKAGLEDVVSYGANEALARVVFDNLGIKYESQWSMRLVSSNGKRLANPKEEVRLKNISTGKIIAEKKNEVKAKIEEITQLNYNQFLRSVMLAQGEFASFLSANAKDKGALLEQITGEEVYKKIGDTLNNRIYSERKILNDIKSKINNEDILSDERTDELIEIQNTVNAQIKENETEIKKYETAVNWLKKSKELFLSTEKLNNEKSAHDKNIEDSKQIFNILDLHEKAEPFKEIINDITRNEKDIKNKTNTLHELKKTLGEISGKITTTKDDELKINKLLIQNQAELTTWLPKLEKVAEFDIEIKNITEAGIKTKKEVDTLSEIIKNIKDIKAQNKQKVEDFKIAASKINIFIEERENTPKIEKKIIKWNESLANRKELDKRRINLISSCAKDKEEYNEIESNLINKKNNLEHEEKVIKILKNDISNIILEISLLNIDGIINKKQKLENNKDILRQLLAHSTHYVEMHKKATELDEEKTKLNKLKHSIDEGEIKLKQEVSIAKELLSNIENIVELERTIVGLKEERARLKEGEPCGLCGSTSHPFIKKYSNIKLSESQTKLDKRKKELSSLEEETRTIEKKNIEVKANLRSNANQRKSIEIEIVDINTKFNSIELELNINDTKLIIKKIEIINNELNSLNQQINKTQQLQKQKNEKDNLWNIDNEKIQITKSEIVKLIEKSKGYSKLISQKNQETKTIIIDIENTENVLTNDLLELNLKLPAIHDNISFINKLEDLILIYNNKTKELYDIDNTTSKLDIEIKNSTLLLKEKSESKIKNENEISKLRVLLKSLNTEREEILPLNITTNEKRNKLQDSLEKTKNIFVTVTNNLNILKTNNATKEKEKEIIEMEISTNSKKLENTTLSLNNSIKNTSFNSIKEVSEALISIDIKTQYSNIRKNILDKSMELDTLKSKLKNEIDLHEKEKSSKIVYNDAPKNRKDVELLNKNLHEKVGEIKEQFKKDNEVRERNAGVFNDIKEQDVILTKWEDLMKLLGGSKHAFNTYVQRLTLQNLIHLANKHLQKLTRRYSLKINKTYITGEELNFKLIDHYQTDEARIIETSSGGEKFLISLALALGLSDLASNNVSVKSLFIDEGFGTLDNNTLETVISTLETLQSQGKMIGIISHVESLKERISTQIQVIKKSNGVSTIEVV